MTNPTLRFRPLRPAVAADGTTSLDLLVTIACAELPAQQPANLRPPLNLALVIDRSGSMAGRKLSDARKAARFLANELTPRDRLAIVSFDDAVTVVVPSTPVTDPLRFITAINTIHCGGSTALFDGWLAGAEQVAEHLDPTQLNRVLLLSDGQANAGLTDPRRIAARVAESTGRGISTSAFGLGDGFDEDLMGAIAGAGDGTFAFIESPSQLADLYASELQGLAATVGRRVSLGLRAKNGAQLKDVLNDLQTTAFGNFQLPNLRAGQELNVGVRLQLPAWTPNQEIASVRLAWDAPGADGRCKQIETLTLPVLSAAELAALEPDAAVAEQFAVLEANRARRRAIEELDRGQVEAASSCLQGASALLAALPDSALARRELRLLKERQALLHDDSNLTRKRLSRESLRSSTTVWEARDDEQA
ncbi:vWA domain-containing protein [Vulcanococcus limneticus]|uniref:vWA domain-containing protein n=1 Tax=Vulcanococcus limneticus TaxID=2170428 RepID=UPI00398BBFBC